MGIEWAANSDLSGFFSIVNLAIEVRIVSPQCGDQDWHCAMADEFAKAAFGCEQPCAFSKLNSRGIVGGVKAKLNGYADEPEQVRGPSGFHITVPLGDEM